MTKLTDKCDLGFNAPTSIFCSKHSQVHGTNKTELNTKEKYGSIKYGRTAEQLEDYKRARVEHLGHKEKNIKCPFCHI